PGFAFVIYDGSAGRVDVPGEIHEMAEGAVGVKVVGVEQVVAIGAAAAEDVANRGTLDAGAVLEDDIVDAALELEEDGGVGVVVVIADAELVAVFHSLDGGVVEAPAGAVQVDAVDGIGIAHGGDGVLVALEIGAGEIAYAA